MAGLDKEGFAVNGDGARVKDAEGNEIQIEGAKTQGDIDKVVKGLKNEIKELRTAKAAAEEKGAEVESLKALIAQKEDEVANAESAAAAKVSEEVDGIKAENQRLKNDATTKTIKNAALAEASEFVKPDYLLNMLNNRGFVDEDNVVRFKVTIEEDGKAVDKVFSAKEAAAHVAKENPALVKGDKPGGANTQTTFGKGTPKRSDMSREQKAAYAKDHGSEAFEKLPD